jgi:outer membrane protein
MSKKGTSFMNVSKKVLTFAVVGVLATASAFAQATPPPTGQPPATEQQPPAKPPATQQPPATPPAGAQPPAKPEPPKPEQPPKPFPEGAKIAYINVQAIASNSIEGKAATAKIQEWNKKKTAELQTKNKQAQDLQAKLQQGGGVLSDAARSQNEKELQKLQRELQGMQEDAQQEQQDMTEKLQAEFQTKLNPIIDQVATEKNLHVVFDAINGGMVWANTGLDITAEVIKRFDASVSKPAAPKK